MFITIEETNCNWFNKLSNDLREYELIGIIFGLAIYNRVILDVHFPSLVYKKLMGVKLTINDLKEINPVITTIFFKNQTLNNKIISFFLIFNISFYYF